MRGATVCCAAIVLFTLGVGEVVGGRASADTPKPGAIPTRPPGWRQQARIHFDRGAAHFAGERYEQAIAEYEIAYQLLPLPDLLFNLAQAHRLRGSKRTAVEYYRRYLAVDPKGRASGESRAFIDQLATEVEKETRLAEPDARDHFESGLRHYRAGAWALAANEFDAAYRILPNVEFLFNLAQARRMNGERRLALDYYREYLVVGLEARAAREAKAHIETLVREIEAEEIRGKLVLPPKNPGPADRGEAGATANSHAKAVYYRRWWFWLPIALSVVAGATGLAVALGDRGPSAASVCPKTTEGCLLVFPGVSP